MRASVVTTLLSLVVASLPGVVRAASTKGSFRIEGYPQVAAVPSRARVLVDDNGNTTSYAYDARDRGTYVVGADLTVQRSVYDADSNVVETIDRNGTTIAYTHDGDHRVVKAEVTRRATNLEGTGQGVEGTGVMAWEYDGLSRPRICVDQNDPTDPSDDVATSYTFDSLSRPLTERHRFRASTSVNSVFTQFGRISVNSAGIDKTIARTFDLDSNRTSTTYSSGRTISYGLDGADRNQQIVDGALGAGPSIQTTEWLGGRPLRSDAGNGVRTSFGYDADRRLSSLTHVGSLGAGTNVASFGYAWTRGNQRASETFSAAGLPGATQTYSYDSASRLVRVAFAGGAAPRPDTTWLIDGVGNQVKKEEDGVATALNVRANGRYLPDLMNEVATFTRFDAMASILGEERHVQDPNGSRIKDGQFKLFFDAFERLVRVDRASDGVVVGRYRYDAAGRRVDRQFRVGGGPLQQVFHVHDGAQEVEELDGAGAVQADFVWGGLYVDQLVQMRRGASTYYAHQNSVFSVVALTDASGAVAERYGYSSVYGVCQVQNADGSSRSSASEVGNPWRFQGRRFDPETGWLYFRARFLDPAAGRWVSRDPLGIWGDAGQIGNAYSFCGNDPVNGVDPTGKLWFLLPLVPYIGTTAATVAELALVGLGIGAAVGVGRELAEEVDDPEGHQFSGGDVAWSAGIGAVALPGLAFAPEGLILFAGLGLYSAGYEYGQGHYATGTYDLVFALGPFGFKGVRTASLGPFLGGPWPGLAPRVARFSGGNPAPPVQVVGGEGHGSPVAPGTASAQILAGARRPWGGANVAGEVGHGGDTPPGRAPFEGEPAKPRVIVVVREPPAIPDRLPISGQYEFYSVRDAAQALFGRPVADVSWTGVSGPVDAGPAGAIGAMGYDAANFSYAQFIVRFSDSSPGPASNVMGTYVSRTECGAVVVGPHVSSGD